MNSQERRAEESYFKTFDRKSTFAC